MFNLFLFSRYTYAIISPTNKIWEKQDKKRCFVLQQIYKGLYFSHLDYLVNSFSQISYLQAYVFLYPKQGLNIYLFVFYFNGPLGMSSFQNHNYSSEQSKLAYHKKHIDLQMKQSSASFFFPFLVSSQVHSIINFTTFVKHLMICIFLCRYCFSIQCILISWKNLSHNFKI